MWCDEIWLRFYMDMRCNLDQFGWRSYYVFLFVFMYFIFIMVMMLVYGFIGVRLFWCQMFGNGVIVVNDVYGNVRKKVIIQYKVFEVFE